MQDTDVTIDTSLLFRTIRRRLLLWVAGGGALFGLLLVNGLYFTSQNFTATASVILQTPAGGGGSPLSFLTGQSGGKKYIGILKSRSLAEKVERQVQLQQFYHLHDKNAALALLMGSLKPEESSNDGLLLIKLSLPGPPPLAPDPQGLRPKVKETVARAVNAYVTGLQDYYIESDNERDSVLLRAAEDRMREARASYEKTKQELYAFVRGLKRYPVQAAPSGKELDPGTPQELLPLYEGRAEVEADILAAEATERARTQMMGSQLKNWANLPTEDPLLRAAREEIDIEKTRLDTLRVQYGEENPRVEASRARLRILERKLKGQMASIRENRTTPQVVSEAQLQGLRAKQNAIAAQIQEAEGRLLQRRELSAEFEALRREAEIGFETLRATITEAAKLQINTVSAKSRVSVVDEALPPRLGAPGITRTTFNSLLPVLALIIVWLVVEYVSLSRRSLAEGVGKS